MDKSKKLKYMVKLALLMAIVILMAFTPIGYLKAGVVEITFIVIPVAVGAIVLGPVAGAFLGGVFGLTSFIQALGTSAFGVALLNINPIGTFVLCMIPRVLMGWLCGLIFKALSKSGKTKIISYFIASLSCALLNTIFFVGGLLIIFGNTEFILGIRDGANLLTFVVTFVGLNGLIEAISSAVIGGAVSKALHLVEKRSY